MLSLDSPWPHSFDAPSVCSHRPAGTDVWQWLFSNSLTPTSSQDKSTGTLLKALLRATVTPVDPDSLMPPNSARPPLSKTRLLSITRAVRRGDVSDADPAVVMALVMEYHVVGRSACHLDAEVVLERLVMANDVIGG